MSDTWNGFTVGPDDWLVLIARDGMTRASIEHVKTQIPSALHGRVMVVDGLDGFVVKAKEAVDV